MRNVADLIEKHGSNIWFEKSAAELWAAGETEELERARKRPRNPTTRWMCGLIRGVLARGLARRKEIAGKDKPFQADMYLEGCDQHRGWFQSSLLLSLAGNGAAPFKTVLTHGFMVDADREKISKSKQGQGGTKSRRRRRPMSRNGARTSCGLWVASQDFRNDIVVSDERINKVAETYRAIRNTLRYQLSNLYDFDPAKHSVAGRQTDRAGPLDPRRVFKIGKRSRRGLRQIRISRRLSKDQPVRRGGAFGDLS